MLVDIELASPVAHIWFLKGVPSRIGTLLDMTMRHREKVLYFENYIVTDPGDTQLKEMELLNEEAYRKKTLEYGSRFKAGMGAEAIRELLRKVDIEVLAAEIKVKVKEASSLGVKKKRTKKLRVVEAFKKTNNKPEWMIMDVIPVLPPGLRPLVPLEGGRFATSDLNDLYRRVINRNNRLKRLIELKAPSVIIKNEKRMLQEAVDALFDNGRRGKVLKSTTKRPLKSLSDMIKGKQGRFRQNLLGKRVDYSGRSVIVVGPDLKLHQCGLPKRMALELFKPFIFNKLEEKGYATTLKAAKKLVEKERPEVWDALEEVIREHPVLLNRAPTLHRLGIQAFDPVLVEGKAIKLHPLVCSAFNADFFGDQMAVHVPLSRAAVKEARDMMLSHHNILLPSSGEATVSPTLDMVLGCYYLTTIRQHKENGKLYGSFEEAKLAYEFGGVDLQEEIEVRNKETNEKLKTSVGRILFNEVLPKELGYFNKIIDKSTLKQIATRCAKVLPDEETGKVLDSIKRLGFHDATKSGITIAMNDIEVPASKPQMLAETEAKVAIIETQYQGGLITSDERYNSIVDIWTETTNNITTHT